MKICSTQNSIRVCCVFSVCWGRDRLIRNNTNNGHSQSVNLHNKHIFLWRHDAQPSGECKQRRLMENRVTILVICFRIFLVGRITFLRIKQFGRYSLWTFQSNLDKSFWSFFVFFFFWTEDAIKLDDPCYFFPQYTRAAIFVDRHWNEFGIIRNDKKCINITWQVRS